MNMALARETSEPTDRESHPFPCGLTDFSVRGEQSEEDSVVTRVPFTKWVEARRRTRINQRSTEAAKNINKRTSYGNTEKSKRDGTCGFLR